MTRYHLGPFKRGLVVESPSEKLDSYLEAQGMEMIRLSYVPNEEQLIEELQKHQAQVLFKRSKVPVTRRVIESCTSLMAIQLCCIGDDSIDKMPVPIMGSYLMILCPMVEVLLDGHRKSHNIIEKAI